jgi:hypothetical protein
MKKQALTAIEIETFTLSPSAALDERRRPVSEDDGDYPSKPETRRRAALRWLIDSADAVWVGTRLLASFEANAHPQYKDRVVAAGVGDTARHLIFGPEFPDASTRGLRNRIVQEWEGRDHPAPYKVVPDSELP